MRGGLASRKLAGVVPSQKRSRKAGEKLLAGLNSSSKGAVLHGNYSRGASEITSGVMRRQSLPSGKHDGIKRSLARHATFRAANFLWADSMPRKRF